MQKENTSPYNSASLFLITIGLVLVNTLIFNYIGRYLGQLFWEVDVTQLVKGHLDFEREHANALRLTQFLSQLGGFVLSVLIVVQMMKKDLLSFTALHERPSVKWFIASLLLFTCLLPGLEWLVQWNARITFPNKMQEIFKELYDNNFKIYDIMLHFNSGIDLLINLIVMALLPAVSEELLFRGLLMRIFRNMFGNIHVAVWVSAVVFAGIHMQAYNIVPMVLMAGIFGYLYYFTGSLWVPIGLHFLNNTSYILMDRYGSPAIDLFNDPVVIIGMALAGIFIFVWMLKKSPQPKSLRLE